MEKIWTKDRERKSMPACILSLHGCAWMPCEKAGKMLIINIVVVRINLLMKIVIEICSKCLNFTLYILLIRNLTRKSYWFDEF